MQIKTKPTPTEELTDSPLAHMIHDHIYRPAIHAKGGGNTHIVLVARPYFAASPQPL